jgi:hypothetical protein
MYQPCILHDVATLGNADTISGGIRRMSQVWQLKMLPKSTNISVETPVFVSFKHRHRYHSYSVQTKSEITRTIVTVKCLE